MDMIRLFLLKLKHFPFALPQCVLPKANSCIFIPTHLFALVFCVPAPPLKLVLFSLNTPLGRWGFNGRLATVVLLGYGPVYDILLPGHLAEDNLVWTNAKLAFQDNAFGLVIMAAYDLICNTTQGKS